MTKDLRARAETFADTAAGPVVGVYVEGNVPRNGEGIGQVVKRALSGYTPVVVIFDLTSLRYQSWDDIGLHVIVETTKGATVPCCLVSGSGNRDDLQSLLETARLAELLEGSIFRTTRSAIRHVREALDG